MLEISKYQLFTAHNKPAVVIEGLRTGHVEVQRNTGDALFYPHLYSRCFQTVGRTPGRSAVCLFFLEGGGESFVCYVYLDEIWTQGKMYILVSNLLS
jgi:hypothetical protein